MFCMGLVLGTLLQELIVTNDVEEELCAGTYAGPGQQHE
jgi:hypothetical protein